MEIKYSWFKFLGDNPTKFSLRGSEAQKHKDRKVKNALEKDIKIIKEVRSEVVAQKPQTSPPLPATSRSKSSSQVYSISHQQQPLPMKLISKTVLHRPSSRRGLSVKRSVKFKLKINKAKEKETSSDDSYSTGSGSDSSSKSSISNNFYATDSTKKSAAPPSPPPALRAKAGYASSKTPQFGNGIKSMNAILHYNFFPERNVYYKNLALRAFRDKKIFMIYGYFPTLRRELRKRGWLEKCSPNFNKGLQNLDYSTLLRKSDRNNDYEIVCISKLLASYPPFFVWQPKYLRDNYNYVNPFRSRIRRSVDHDFTSKEGLWQCYNNSHWYTIPGLSEMSMPRVFNLAMPEEVTAFQKNFQISCCFALLKFVGDNINNTNLQDENVGKISLEIIKFARDQIMEEISCINNEDVDIELTLIQKRKGTKSSNNHLNKNNSNSSNEKSNVNEPNTSIKSWGTFIKSCEIIINGLGKFNCNKKRFALEATRCKITVTKAREYWPTIDIDGYYNLWILKPGYQCRGLNIHILKDYNEIIEMSKQKSHLKYVVQKYIERPLLISSTKFDIRQYLLLTVTEDSLNIWMYMDCYLRFSSQKFDLHNFSESVHLTNHAIQKKYKNCERDDRLPQNNMWSLADFQQYLSDIGKAHVWNDKISPAIKCNLIGVTLSSMETIELKENTFELFGCDFLIDENFNVHLLEVNSTPDLSYSTTVTAKICRKALEDLVKVIIDIPHNPSLTTGNFKLVHSVRHKFYDVMPSLITKDIRVEGKRMKIYEKNKPHNEKEKKVNSKLLTYSNSGSYSSKKSQPNNTSKGSKPSSNTSKKSETSGKLQTSSQSSKNTVEQERHSGGASNKSPPKNFCTGCSRSSKSGKTVSKKRKRSTKDNDSKSNDNNKTNISHNNRNNKRKINKNNDVITNKKNNINNDNNSNSSSNNNNNNNNNSDNINKNGKVRSHNGDDYDNDNNNKNTDNNIIIKDDISNVKSKTSNNISNNSISSSIIIDSIKSDLLSFTDIKKLEEKANKSKCTLPQPIENAKHVNNYYRGSPSRENTILRNFTEQQNHNAFRSRL